MQKSSQSKTSFFIIHFIFYRYYHIFLITNNIAQETILFLIFVLNHLFDNFLAILFVRDIY